MSDIHGRYDLLVKMFDIISFKTKDKLYIIGDICDRGPYNIEMMNFCMNYSENVSLILGNHDYMMKDGLNCNFEDNMTARVWDNNGGGITRSQILSQPKEFKEKLKQYINGLDYFRIINVNNKQYILSHAGFSSTAFMKYISEKNIKNNEIDSIDSIDLMNYCNKDEYLDDCVWARDCFSEFEDCTLPNFDFNTKFIIGHTPVQLLNNSNKIFYGQNFIDIDCGAPFSNGKLACLRLDDMKEFYC
jgi:serine/threonine protein phosphatase 1